MRPTIADVRRSHTNVEAFSIRRTCSTAGPRKATERPPEEIMRLLLTSAGVNNPTIRDALVDLLPKPIDECTALCIPTAQYGHPHVGPGVKPWGFVSGREDSQMTQLGWKSV